MAFSVADVVGIASGGGAIGILGTWFQQRNRRQDRHDDAVLAGSGAAAKLATAAIAQWQEIVGAQSTINAEHLQEINRLRRRAEECEHKSQQQDEAIHHLRNQVRMLRANVTRERRHDD